MITMRMVKASVDEIVHVIAMRDGLVAATGAMHMTSFVPAGMSRASGWVPLADLNHMLVHMVAMGVVQMAIMQIVDMIVVADRCMAAARPMLVIMVGVVGCTAYGHGVVLGLE